MVNPNTLLFPIGSKVRYSKEPCNGYDSKHGLTGFVSGHGEVGVDVDFGDNDGPWYCYAEELTLVENVDQDGQYRMAL